MPGDGDKGELNRHASCSFGVSGGDRGEKKRDHIGGGKRKSGMASPVRCRNGISNDEWKLSMKIVGISVQMFQFMSLCGWGPF